MLKLLLKIWPAFIPIIVYIFWVYVVEGVVLKKEKIIEGEKSAVLDFCIVRFCTRCVIEGSSNSFIGLFAACVVVE